MNGRRSGKPAPTIERIVTRRREQIKDGRESRALIRRVVFIALVACVLFTQVFLICQNKGQDMFPALKDGDLCVAMRSRLMALTKQSLARDDVILYNPQPEPPSFEFGARVRQVLPLPVRDALEGWLTQALRSEAGQMLFPPEWTQGGERRTGRVVAAAGDVVNIGDTGSLIVNGTTQGGEIMFPTERRGDLEYPYRVPEGCVFVLGDYRTNTRDSRDFGAVPLENVHGKVITILRRRGL